MKLIDAEHLKRWLTARWLESDPTSDKPIKMADILNQIDYGELSIDIVRCGECKYSGESLLYPNEMVCKYHLGDTYYTEADRFCYYGERSVDDEPKSKGNA